MAGLAYLRLAASAIAPQRGVGVRMRRVVPFFALLLTLPVSSASAEPIHITSGSLTGFSPATTSGGQILLSGEGFAFAGSTGTGFVAAANEYVLGIAPGATLDLRANWTGLGVGGAVTFSGRQFHAGGIDPGVSPKNAEILGVTWSGTLTLPSSFSGGSVTAPFQFSGLVAVPDGIGFHHIDLTGSGTATLTFGPSLNLGLFRLTAISYDFEDPAATPEPGSMVLLGTGLFGLVRVVRRTNVRRRLLSGMSAPR